MQPKKRGEGVTARVDELAGKLEKTPEVLMAALAAAGLTPPDSPKGKPTFAEHGGELVYAHGIGVQRPEGVAEAGPAGGAADPGAAAAGGCGHAPARE